MRASTGILLTGVLWLCGGLLYGPFLQNPIFFDDIYVFMLDEDGRSAISQFSDFSWIELRSLPYATLAWTEAWFGPEPFPFRLGGLLIHLATVYVLFRFSCALFGQVLADKEGALPAQGWAFFVALLFALHPVAVYAVGYLIQRSILMATLFSLLALWAYLQASLSGRRYWLLPGVFFYYLAVFSKEHAIMLPTVFLALEVLLHADWRQRVRRNWLTYLACLLIASLAVLARKGMFGGAYELDGAGMVAELGVAHPYPLSVLTQCWLFFKYGLLWLAPNPDWMSVDMREPFATDFASPYLAAPLLFLAWGGTGFRLLLRRGNAGLLGFAMLFPWLMFMTELVAVRIQEPFVLYRSYLWATGAVLALPVLLGWLRKRTALVVLLSTALAYFPISTERLGTFSHPLLLWGDALALLHGRDDLPGAHRILYNYGTVLWGLRLNLDVAEQNLERAGELYPHWPDIYGNLGQVLLLEDQPARALAAFDRALRVVAESGAGSAPRYRHGRGEALEALGRKDEAAAEYRLVCQAIRKDCDKAGMLPP